MSDISELNFDDKNFNKHTEFGMASLEKSLRNYGAGRSILVDKDNNIIAGNGIAEIAGQIGLTKTRVIETTGDELVVVKRTDVSLNSQKGREMAFADNATASVDLAWDTEKLGEAFSKDELLDWGVDLGKAEDFSNDEVDIDDLEEEQELKLKFKPEEYSFVLDKLREKGNDFPHSLLTILGYYNE